MTTKNCTIKVRGKQTSISIGDTYTNKQGLVATVIDYKNKSDVTVVFDDERNTVCSFYANALRAGSFKNPYHPSVFGVGFFGVGPYKSSDSKGRSCEYATWQDMLRRCYDNEYLNRNPSYIGCSVHPDWHNFQVFAEWLTNNKYHKLGYQLDKDIINIGNKIYSENDCRLVPSEINTLLTDRRGARGDYPQGVRPCSWGKKYRASVRCGSGKNRRQLGSYNTPEEASKVYKEAKKEQIRQRAIEWKGRIDNDVFESLMRIANNYC